MISLFRRIRQNLLQQNRITQYLAYAVGEILLVVIGILIALRINPGMKPENQPIRTKNAQGVEIHSPKRQGIFYFSNPKT